MTDKEQWFWEQCGLKLMCSPEKDQCKRGIWETPDGLRIDTPDLNSIEALGYLFKYAVPVYIDKVMVEQECSSDMAYAILFKKWLQELELDIPHAATALFKVLYKALGGKE